MTYGTNGSKNAHSAKILTSYYTDPKPGWVFIELCGGWTLLCTSVKSHTFDAKYEQEESCQQTS
jgi:hypothetical protein